MILSMHRSKPCEIWPQISSLTWSDQRLLLYLDSFLRLELELALRNIALAGLSGSFRVRRQSRSNIPDSAGFRSSSLLLWMVLMVSAMLSSISEISRLLRVTCLQIDLQQFWLE